MNRWTPMAGVTLASVLSAVAVYTPAQAVADTCTDAATSAALPLDIGPCADVLAQERRWLAAITAGDVPTVEAILSPTFKHINSEGRLLTRAEEIASMEPLPFTMNPSDQIVDIAGNTAVIHGINTLIQPGADGESVIGVERFTDVFELQNGQWMALSAQETAT
ncbi:nuclear transport factor 2 family protein [Mycobacterium barrassiae]|uniref:nuclear transport factor 2 family protein n=1 Tax=Mycobacterium barrassiae TaxID=319709 RepID=UPI002265D0C3|nr:nuclear transport factor 2 family protein [Mycobacterium barrassiae]MCV7302345.1 nuclear transport factor 2 family protein [Mycobacterium barrassiae]